MSYDGPERRKNMDEDLVTIREHLAGLSAKVEEWMRGADDYREKLCSKINDISNKIYDLPCKERKSWYDGMGRQVGFMWVVLGLLLTSVLANMWLGHSDKVGLKQELSADISRVEAKINGYHQLK
jgi:hypothetical protein